MMKRLLLLGSIFLQLQKTASAQQPVIVDTVHELEAVVLHAFERRSGLLDGAGATAFVIRQDIQKYGNHSIVPAINNLPGVRMEERSPASYRINIRGSSQRSPFGVRNVKIYYNLLPFTDAGGHSFLNQLGAYNIGSIEILKGPASSMYGAGTGGTMLVENYPSADNAATFALVAGSYGTYNTKAEINTVDGTMSNHFQWQRQSSDGYREHSAMKRDVLSWVSTISPDKRHKIAATVLYGKLFYNTPGGLTKAQYEANPRQARPSTPFVAGAIENKAAISQEMFLGGISYEWTPDTSMRVTTVAYGNFVTVRNPTFLNYGKTSEPHFGARATLHLEKKGFCIDAGVEAQRGVSRFSTFSNKKGTPDSLMLEDHIAVNNVVLFGQVKYFIKNWAIAGGASYNSQQLNIDRLYPRNVGATRQQHNVLSPRFELSYKPAKKQLIYITVAKGFSPPTTSEVVPSNGIINQALRPEVGWNYEAGYRMIALRGKLLVDISAFNMRLLNTIVQRRSSAGADYFINAGSTRQQGIELFTSFRFQQPNIKIRSSYTYHNFRYENFKQVGNDYSGNAMPGVAPHFLMAGIDGRVAKTIYYDVSYNYSAKQLLNDAGTASAESFHLLSAKLEKDIILRKADVRLFIGGDNILNEVYSLGNDLNAFGGRYYNVAPARSFYIGIEIKLQTKWQ